MVHQLRRQRLVCRVSLNFKDTPSIYLEEDVTRSKGAGCYKISATGIGEGQTHGAVCFSKVLLLQPLNLQHGRWKHLWCTLFHWIWIIVVVIDRKISQTEPYEPPPPNCKIVFKRIVVRAFIQLFARLSSLSSCTGSPLLLNLFKQTHFSFNIDWVKLLLLPSMTHTSCISFLFNNIFSNLLKRPARDWFWGSERMPYGRFDRIFAFKGTSFSTYNKKQVIVEERERERERVKEP